MPAQAGIQSRVKSLDPGFRRDDDWSLQGPKRPAGCPAAALRNLRASNQKNAASGGMRLTGRRFVFARPFLFYFAVRYSPARSGAARRT